MVDLLDEGPREQVREALSQVQMLYAREARGGAGRPPAVGAGDAASGAGRRGPEPPPRSVDPGAELWSARSGAAIRSPSLSTRASRPERSRPLLD